MKKVCSICLFLMLLCITLPAAADDVYEWHYQMPRLDKYELSLTKRTYYLHIPIIESSGNYAGPAARTVQVVGTWEAGKATETTSCYQNQGELVFRLVKTADCPQDPWLTEQPVYNSMQKKTEYLSSWGWVYEQASWIMKPQNFVSAGLLSATKAMLRTELAKTPPVIKSPASGLTFPAMQPVKVTIEKHPDYPLLINYEYRAPGQADFTSAFPPSSKNSVNVGGISSQDIYFFLAGAWRLHARTNVPGSQYSEWLTLNIIPSKPAIQNPLQGSTHYLKLNVNKAMEAGVTLSIEHNHSEKITVNIQYRPDGASTWTDAAPSMVKLNLKPTGTMRTEGYVHINKAGEYRIQVYGDVSHDLSEWRQFSVARLPLFPLKN